MTLATSNLFNVVTRHYFQEELCRKFCDLYMSIYGRCNAYMLVTEAVLF